MSEEEKIRQILEIDFCDVKCPQCGSYWISTLSGDPFECLKCKHLILPKKHAVVESETEVN